MGSNKTIRKILEELYEKGCMFKKAKIEEKIEAKRTIKTYKRFLQEKRYTKKQIERFEKIMTVHHLKHSSEGGKTDIKNTAIVNALAHCYMHSLPREQEEYINNELRKYKGQKCKVVFVDKLDIPFEIRPTTFSVDERGRYNRAKEKRELKKLEEEYWEEK